MHVAIAIAVYASSYSFIIPESDVNNSSHDSECPIHIDKLKQFVWVIKMLSTVVYIVFTTASYKFYINYVTIASCSTV